MARVDNIEKELGHEIEWHSLSELQAAPGKPLAPPMVTLLILGGRKEKIRPGDVLGALTGEAGFSKEQIGKINVTDTSTYVAVARSIAKEALRKLSAGTIKGKKVKVHLLKDQES
jgi:ATP-independent RNA helicase DbpA